jgi:hypothetical protein
MVPPEFSLEGWRASLRRLQAEHARGSFSQLAPTHFGAFPDPAWHLAKLAKALDEVETWMEAIMPTSTGDADLMEAYLSWVGMRMKDEGIPEELHAAYQIVNPPFISVAGIQRYWKKFRTPVEG